jgi:hypothetical protein
LNFCPLALGPRSLALQLSDKPLFCSCGDIFLLTKFAKVRTFIIGCMCMWLCWCAAQRLVLLKGLSCSPRVVVVHIRNIPLTPSMPESVHVFWVSGSKACRRILRTIYDWVYGIRKCRVKLERSKLSNYHFQSHDHLWSVVVLSFFGPI